MRMRTRKEIIEWLIFNGAWEAYKRNVKQAYHALKDTLNLGKDAIVSAFVWDKAPEGHGYWFDTNDRYQAWYEGKADMCGRAAIFHDEE